MPVVLVVAVAVVEAEVVILVSFVLAAAAVAADTPAVAFAAPAVLDGAFVPVVAGVAAAIELLVAGDAEMAVDGAISAAC